jgi:hypothetical protein
MAGLDNSKSTYIQMDNVGYARKSNQTARYSNNNKYINPLKANGLSFTNNGFKGIMDNYSNSTMSGSSSDRLNKSLSINRYF